MGRARAQSLTPFVPINHLGAGGSAETNLHIDFAGSRQPLRFHLTSDRGAFPADIRAPQGELLRPSPLSRAEFAAIRGRLGGMHESTARLPARPDGESSAALARAVLRCLNMAVLDTDADAGGEAGGEVLFSAATLHSEQPVLLSLLPEPGGLKVLVHADDAMAGPLLLDEAKEALKLR